MKLRIIVGMAMFISLFLACNIFLFGYMEGNIFMILYFFLLLISALIILLSIKKLFENKGEIIVILIFVVLISLSGAYLAGSIQRYITPMTYSPADNLQQEIDYISDQNKYYLSYIDYQLKLIDDKLNELQTLEANLDSTMSESSAIKDATITDLEETIALLQSHEPVIQTVQEPVYIYVYPEENEREYEDD